MTSTETTKVQRYSLSSNCLSMTGTIAIIVFFSIVLVYMISEPKANVFSDIYYSDTRIYKPTRNMNCSRIKGVTAL